MYCPLSTPVEAVPQTDVMQPPPSTSVASSDWADPNPEPSEDQRNTHRSAGEVNGKRSNRFEFLQRTSFNPAILNSSALEGGPRIPRRSEVTQHVRYIRQLGRKRGYKKAFPSIEALYDGLVNSDREYAKRKMAASSISQEFCSQAESVLGLTAEPAHEATNMGKLMEQAGTASRELVQACLSNLSTIIPDLLNDSLRFPVYNSTRPVILPRAEYNSAAVKQFPHCPESHLLNVLRSLHAKIIIEVLSIEYARVSSRIMRLRYKSETLLQTAVNL